MQNETASLFFCRVLNSVLNNKVSVHPFQRVADSKGGAFGRSPQRAKLSFAPKSAGMADTKRLLPAPISAEMKEKIQNYAVGAFLSLGCSGVSRVDFLIDKDTDEIYVNEINTIPGSLSFYLWEATGLKYPELLDEIIRLALKREREEGKINYSFDTNILSGVSFGGAKGKA